MSSANWIETKQECEVGEDGELVVKKVTREIDKGKESPWKYKPKELIDLLLRVISIAAIAIPIFLFYKGQQAERDRQKALFQLDVYSNTASQIHGIINEEMGSIGFEKSKNRLFFELYPKHVLLNNKSITDTLTALNDIISYTSFISGLTSIADSLENYFLYRRDEQGRRKFNKASVKSAINVHLHYIDKLLTWNNVSWNAESNSKLSNNFIDSTEKEFANLAYDLSDYLSKVAYSSNLDIEGVEHLVYHNDNGPVQWLLNYKAEYDKKFRSLASHYNRELDSMMTKSNAVLYNK